MPDGKCPGRFSSALTAHDMDAAHITLRRPWKRTGGADTVLIRCFLGHNA